MIKKKKEAAAKKLINTEMTLKRASDAMIADDVNNSLKNIRWWHPLDSKQRYKRN